MTDRELLEAAAKAVGQERSVGGDLWSNARGQLWNPLADDGDALRLAMKLRLDVRHWDNWDGTTKISAEHPDIKENSVMEGADQDLSAAARRVIVRAAAALAVSDLAKMEGAK